MTLANGIPYCFAEVTCDTGSQFGIAAYGDEYANYRRRVPALFPKIVPTSRTRIAENAPRSSAVEESVAG